MSLNFIDMPLNPSDSDFFVSVELPALSMSFYQEKFTVKFVLRGGAEERIQAIAKTITASYGPTTASFEIEDNDRKILKIEGLGNFERIFTYLADMNLITPRAVQPTQPLWPHFIELDQAAKAARLLSRVATEDQKCYLKVRITRDLWQVMEAFDTCYCEVDVQIFASKRERVASVVNMCFLEKAEEAFRGHRCQASHLSLTSARRLANFYNGRAMLEEGLQKRDTHIPPCIPALQVQREILLAFVQEELDEKFNSSKSLP